MTSSFSLLQSFAAPYSKLGGGGMRTSGLPDGTGGGEKHGVVFLFLKKLVYKFNSLILPWLSVQIQNLFIAW